MKKVAFFRAKDLAGADTFIFETTLNATTNKDTITDFNITDDTIKLENAIFAKLTTVGTLNTANFYKSATGIAHDSNDYIVYETDTGKLFYDADGNGAGAAVQIALIGAANTHAALTNADFVVI
jgi:hypothetical protein